MFSVGHVDSSRISSGGPFGLGQIDRHVTLKALFSKCRVDTTIHLAILKLLGRSEAHRRFCPFS